MEASLVRKHVECVKTNRVIADVLTTTALSVSQLQASAFNVKHCIDGHDDPGPQLSVKFHSVLAELVDLEVLPFVGIADVASPSDLIRAQIYSGLLFMEQIKDGGRDAATSMDFLRLTEGGFQIATQDLDASNVGASRDAQMRCLADSMTVFCQWPMALKMLTCSQDAHRALVVHRNAHAEFVRACPPEKMDYTLVKRSNAIRVQCSRM